MSKPYPVDAVIANLSQWIAESKVIVAADELVDLSGMDQYVAALCEAVEKLSPEERMRHTEKLQQLHDDVGVLCRLMEEKKAALGGEIRQASQFTKATSAYRITDKIGEWVKPDDD